MRIYFKEKTHQYFNENDEQYISVSALAKKLEAPKDWDLIKKKYAKKNGMKISDVTSDWERKKNLGTQAGTIYHSQREQELLDSPQEYDKVKLDKVACTFDKGLKWGISIEQLADNTIYPELIIYDHEKKICGQSDKVIVVNGIINLEDYKTDKSIERKAFSNERVKPEKLLPPVAHLDNCNYNMYSLKMSMYMYMLWNANKHLKTGKIILEHVQLERDEDEIPILIDGKPIVKDISRIEVPYRRKEVKLIFDAYKNGELK